MKVNLEIIPRPMVTSFTMFEQLDIAKLKETKTIKVSTHMETKTRVSTDFQVGECCQKINWQMEGFKTFEKTEYNYFSGKDVTSHYFVLSKKQGRESYIEYVKKLIEFLVVEKLQLELDEITIKLVEPKF